MALCDNFSADAYTIVSIRCFCIRRMAIGRMFRQCVKTLIERLMADVRPHFIPSSRCPPRQFATRTCIAKFGAQTGRKVRHILVENRATYEIKKRLRYSSFAADNYFIFELALDCPANRWTASSLTVLSASLGPRQSSFSSNEIPVFGRYFRLMIYTHSSAILPGRSS